MLFTILGFFFGFFDIYKILKLSLVFLLGYINVKKPVEKKSMEESSSDDNVEKKSMEESSSDDSFVDEMPTLLPETLDNDNIISPTSKNVNVNNIFECSKIIRDLLSSDSFWVDVFIPEEEYSLNDKKEGDVSDSEMVKNVPLERIFPFLKKDEPSPLFNQDGTPRKQYNPSWNHEAAYWNQYKPSWVKVTPYWTPDADSWDPYKPSWVRPMPYWVHEKPSWVTPSWPWSQYKPYYFDQNTPENILKNSLAQDKNEFERILISSTLKGAKLNSGYFNYFKNRKLSLEQLSLLQRHKAKLANVLRSEEALLSNSRLNLFNLKRERTFLEGNLHSTSLNYAVAKHMGFRFGENGWEAQQEKLCDLKMDLVGLNLKIKYKNAEYQKLKTEYKKYKDLWNNRYY